MSVSTKVRGHHSPAGDGTPAGALTRRSSRVGLSKVMPDPIAATPEWYTRPGRRPGQATTQSVRTSVRSPAVTTSRNGPAGSPARWK